FSVALDGAARDDKVASACGLLAGLVARQGCDACQAMFQDGGVIRVLSPWGASGGAVDVPASVVVSMACAGSPESSAEACVQTLSGSRAAPAPARPAAPPQDGSEGVGEAREPLSPLSIACGLLVALPFAWACSKSFDTSTCGAGE